MALSEYSIHIETYANDGQKYFSTMLSAANWGDREAAGLYLRKFWLPANEFETRWKLVQDRIFVGKSGLPDMIFDRGYEIMAFRGGCLFEEEDFARLQKCWVEVGDRYFFVIENTFNGTATEPAFQMKYPANIGWDEMISGNFISATILNSSHKEFFVFGESSGWGKYAASDYKAPLDIIGFQSKYSSIFRRRLKIMETESREIHSWLPSQYRDIVTREGVGDD